MCHVTNRIRNKYSYTKGSLGLTDIAGKTRKKRFGRIERKMIKKIGAVKVEKEIGKLVRQKKKMNEDY